MKNPFLRFYRLSNCKGFNLMELMITVAIVGILTAIALPSYKDYVTRGKIPDATSGLAGEQVKMEQFFQDNGTYVAAPGCTSASSSYFDFSCSSAATATTFTLQAVGKGTMAGFTYTVDEANVKKTIAVPSGWTLPSTNCWITSKGGAC